MVLMVDDCYLDRRTPWVKLNLEEWKELESLLNFGGVEFISLPQILVAYEPQVVN